MSAAAKLVAEPRFLESLKSLPEPSRQWIQELIGSVDNFESALSKRPVDRILDALGPGMEVVSVRPGCLIYFERKGGGVHLKDLVYLEQSDVQGTASENGASSTAAELADRIIDPPQGLSVLFSELAEQWNRETRYLSSTSAIATHPAYQRIIGLGPRVVPLILAELQRQPGHWFWALAALTGENPVPPADKGRLTAMTESWLKWGRENGWIA